MVGPARFERATGAVEHGDRPMASSDLARYLDDLKRLNAWFGGYRLTALAVDHLLGRGRAAREVPVESAGRGGAGRRVLVADVGGARGDLAAYLERRASTRGTRLGVVVVDRDHAALAAGRRGPGAAAGIHWVQADACALPLRDGAVEVATTSLTLHHLEPDAAVVTLAALRRVARLGVVVNDLVRTRVAYALVTLAVWLVARHPFSRTDGPLSVRRAYRPEEVDRMARAAGFRRLRIVRSRVFARMIAVGS